MRIIKKYPNRRLYDTTRGTYITLDDVKKLVFEHEPFQVLDARSQKDLTQNTLLQIIAEQEISSTPIFTTPMLLNVIRMYQEKSQNMLSQYLEQALSVFTQQKDFMQNQFFSYQKIFSDVFLQSMVKSTDQTKSNMTKSQEEKISTKVLKKSKNN